MIDYIDGHFLTNTTLFRCIFLSFIRIRFRFHLINRLNENSQESFNNWLLHFTKFMNIPIFSNENQNHSFHLQLIWLHIINISSLTIVDCSYWNVIIWLKVKLRTTLEELASSCLKYVTITKDSLTGAGSGKTKLDKERIKLCQREIVSD